MEARQALQSKLALELGSWTGIEDTRPRDYVYALMSQQVYRGNQLKPNDRLPNHKDWKVHSVEEGGSEYFGAIYINNTTKQVVVTHRGTNSLSALKEDLNGVYLNKLSPQKEVVFKIVQKGIALAKEEEATLSFTGHSLGAFLAEISVFYCYKSFEFPQVSAVTFESPGTQETLELMQPNLAGERIDLRTLDVVGYVSYPNLINTCNHHIGTLYQLTPMLGDKGWVPGWFTKKAHSMDGLVQLFDSTHARPKELQYLKDWPMGSQRAIFFETAEFKEGRYNLLTEEELRSLNSEHFALDYQGHYSFDMSLSQANVLPLKHFRANFQSFLMAFYQWKLDIPPAQQASLEEKLKSAKVPEEIRNYLLGYSLVQRNNLIMVVLEPELGDIIDFREEASKWLVKDKNAEKINQLLKQATGKTAEIIAAILAPGAELLQGGVIENVKSSGLEVIIPEDTSEEDIRHIHDILTKITTSTSKIEAYILAPGAKVSGKITNAVVVGASVQIQRDLGRASSSSASSSTQSQRGQETPPLSISTPAYDNYRRGSQEDAQRPRVPTEELIQQRPGNLEIESVEKILRVTAGGTSGGK